MVIYYYCNKTDICRKIEIALIKIEESSAYRYEKERSIIEARNILLDVYYRKCKG